MPSSKVGKTVQRRARFPWGTQHFGLPKEEAEPFYEAVETLFHKQWLENWQPPNRVAETWRREDFLAGLELACFGSAIQAIQRVDPVWTGEVAKKIRRAPSGSEHGFIFELLACGMLAAGGMNIRPCRKNEPGKDAEIVFPDGFTLRLSIKNHDISEHETRFRKHAASLRDSLHKRMGVGEALHLVVQGREHLSAEDFLGLRAQLAHLPVGMLVDVDPGRVTMWLHHMQSAAGELPFARDRRHDQLTVFCPQHANEKPKFAANLRKACANMAAHCPRSPHSANLVLMRLHPSASTADLATVAYQLLQEDGTGVDAIMLYQPSMTRNMDGASQLVHHAMLKLGPQYPRTGYVVQMAALLGAMSQAPSSLQLRVNREAALSLENHYVYQVGDVYRALRFTPAGRNEGDLTVTAPGLRNHLVVEMPDGGFDVLGKFAVQEELRLI